MDSLTPEQRRRCMSSVKGKNTRLEVDFRKKLWISGIRYRLGYKLTGKPDLVFVGAKVAVFVDGCFWHGCPLHGQIPKTNREFWEKKLTRNLTRDKEVTSELINLNWTVVRLWEHELKQDLERCVRDLCIIIRDRANSGKKTKTKEP